jgi:hypothetical protein
MKPLANDGQVLEVKNGPNLSEVSFEHPKITLLNQPGSDWQEGGLLLRIALQRLDRVGGGLRGKP